MPEIKHYDKKKHHAKKHHPQKRRPHHEAEEAMTEVDETMTETDETLTEAATNRNQAAGIQGEFEGISGEGQQATTTETEAINTEAQNEGVNPESTDYTEPEKHKMHLHFLGSELIRQKAPKVMDLAETVADEWVHDGKFEGLPVGNPLAQMAAAKALRTAKDVEKKLEEKGVFTMAKMGVDYLKSKIEKKK